MKSKNLRKIGIILVFAIICALMITKPVYAASGDIAEGLVGILLNLSKWLILLVGGIVDMIVAGIASIRWRKF